MSQEVIVSYPEVTVDRLAKTMTASNIGAIPIVVSESDRTLVGIMTDRDIVTRVVSHGIDPRLVPAQNVMSRNLIVCTTTDSLAEAMYMMMRYGIGRLPVVDEDNSVVGVISATDLADTMRLPMKSPGFCSAIARNALASDFEITRATCESDYKVRLEAICEEIEEAALSLPAHSSQANHDAIYLFQQVDIVQEQRRLVEAIFSNLKEAQAEEWQETKNTFEIHWSELNRLYSRLSGEFLYADKQVELH